MNSLENLLNNGIDIKTAYRMLEEYSNRINTMSGVYKIIDINYDFSIHGKDVTLQCSECGRIIHRTMISGRNKWSELIKSCECQKEKKRSQRERVQKISKNKKAYIERLLGNEYGDYVVTDIDFSGKTPQVVLNCKICGSEKRISYTSIENGRWKDIKCHKHHNPIKYDESYIGKKKNFLTVIGITRLPNNHRAFICECDCGNITTIEPTFWEQGVVKSCGCFARSLQLEHSEELDRLRRIYNGMFQRCYNPNSNAYRHYGGRGITVCEEWHDREKFIEWALNNEYSNDLSIDRINVNGNYEPSNCRWADAKTQANNQRPRTKGYTRKQKTVTIDGTERPISEWYIIFNTTGPTIAYRMKTLGLSFEDALKMPKITNGRPRKEV